MYYVLCCVVLLRVGVHYYRTGVEEHYLSTERYSTLVVFTTASYELATRASMLVEHVEEELTICPRHNGDGKLYTTTYLGDGELLATHYLT